jgi:hypothetical protein
MTLEQAHAEAMAAPGPSIRMRAKRARRILARMGIVAALAGCSGARPTPQEALRAAHEFCDTLPQVEAFIAPHAQPSPDAGVR